MASPTPASVDASVEDDFHTLLDIHNLKMHFPIQAGFLNRTVGHVKAVDDVSFTIREGETLSLVGESGCGKTTVGRCIVRAYKPTGGRILYREDINRLTGEFSRMKVHYRNPDARRDVASDIIDLAQLKRNALATYRREIRMIFQDPYSSLNPRMTVLDLVGEVLKVNNIAKGSELQDRVAKLLKRVGLRPEYMRRYPHAFSGGERQRIVIARALATDPRLIVADEAISALDVSIRAQILNLMEELQEEFGLTYLFIAHDLSVVRHISNRVAVMYVGKLVETAPVHDLYTNPLHPYTEALMSAVPISNPRQRKNRKRIRLQGEVADPANPPTGCYFHPRCRFAEDRCRVEEPPLRQIAPDRRVACHFAEQLDLNGAFDLAESQRKGNSTDET